MSIMTKTPKYTEKMEIEVGKTKQKSFYLCKTCFLEKQMAFPPTLNDDLCSFFFFLLILVSLKYSKD